MRRLHEQVEMIGHQNVGVNPAPTLQLRLSKTFQEKPVIVFCKKYSLAIVAALDDMMRINGLRRPERSFQSLWVGLRIFTIAHQ